MSLILSPKVSTWTWLNDCWILVQEAILHQKSFAHAIQGNRIKFVTEF